MLEIINHIKDKTPEYRFTGNLFKRYPYLLDCKPLPDQHRLRLILSPIELTWYFVSPQGRVFNFYPVWLKLSSQTAGINYTSISYKLNLKQSANIHLNNYIKY